MPAAPAGSATRAEGSYMTTDQKGVELLPTVDEGAASAHVGR